MYCSVTGVIGEQLPPERTTRSTAGDSHRFHGDTHVFDDRALVSEGAKRLPEVREAQLRALDETRELYQQLGIKNIDRAMQNQIEHSPIGADEDHTDSAAIADVRVVPRAGDRMSDLEATAPTEEPDDPIVAKALVLLQEQRPR
jgi:hypothetical protein